MTVPYPEFSSAQQRPEPGSRSSGAGSGGAPPVIPVGTAAEAGSAVARHGGNCVLLSPPGAGAAFGLPWWLEVTGAHRDRSILDCGGSAPIARAALEAGVGRVICRAAPAQIAALRAEPRFTGRVLENPPQERSV